MKFIRLPLLLTALALLACASEITPPTDPADPKAISATLSFLLDREVEATSSNLNDLASEVSVKWSSDPEFPKSAFDSVVETASKDLKMKDAGADSGEDTGANASSESDTETEESTGAAGEDEQQQQTEEAEAASTPELRKRSLLKLRKRSVRVPTLKDEREYLICSACLCTDHKLIASIPTPLAVNALRNKDTVLGKPQGPARHGNAAGAVVTKEAQSISGGATLQAVESPEDEAENSPSPAKSTASPLHKRFFELLAALGTGFGSGVVAEVGESTYRSTSVKLGQCRASCSWSQARWVAKEKHEHYCENGRSF